MTASSASDLLIAAAEVGAALTAHGQTVATAESCTAGLVSAALTRVPGASKFLWGGVAVYSAAAKVVLADVDPEVVRRYGTVSEETTVALAEGIRRRSGTTYGLAVTGWAGPSEDPEEPVGLVFGAIADGRHTISRRWSFSGDRDAVRAAATAAVVGLLRERLAGVEDAPQ